LSTSDSRGKHETQRSKHAEAKVIQTIEGTVNSEVTIELPGGIAVVAIITKKSVSSLGLSVGKDAYAVIKASSVMVAVD
jgi:molybdopterin-binding protein